MDFMIRRGEMRIERRLSLPGNFLRVPTLKESGLALPLWLVVGCRGLQRVPEPRRRVVNGDWALKLSKVAEGKVGGEPPSSFLPFPAHPPCIMGRESREREREGECGSLGVCEELINSLSFSLVPSEMCCTINVKNDIISLFGSFGPYQIKLFLIRHKDREEGLGLLGLHSPCSFPL